ncbi:MAG: VIT domain-containing protein [Gemmatimonadaceae bacterium]
MRRVLSAPSIALAAAIMLPLTLSAQGILIPVPCLPNRICPPVQWGLVRTASNVRVTMEDRVLHYEVEERFTNRGGGIAEADYIFPLPVDAAFQDLKLSIDGQLVAGETMSADKARGIYEEIVRRQRDPALVEWMGRGMLRARIFPIRAGEEKRVVVRFDAVARREGDALRVDYRRAGNNTAMRDERYRDRGMRDERTASSEDETFSLTIPDNDALGTPCSPTHRLVRRLSSGRITVEAEGNNSDVTVLVPLRSSSAASVSVLANATSASERFALITLTPPTRAVRHTPRDVTLVLDVSGSMSGRKLIQAKAAGRQVLATLNEGDRFRIIDFSTDVRTFRDDFVAASAPNVREAQRYLDALDAQGSTNISGALDEALRVESPENRLPLVLFLTDGAPTVGETQPDAIAAAAAKERGRARVFTFGVGADVNAALVERLALEAHGTATFVRPEEDVERAVSVVASRLTDPIVTDLRVHADGVRLDRVLPAGGIDLFAGQDLVVLARYEGDGAATLRFTGRSANGPVEWSERVNFPARERGNSFVPRLWATQRVGWLSAEKRRGGSTTEIDDEIRALGERYAIPTEFTSYLVQEPGMVAGNVPLLQNQSGGSGTAGRLRSQPPSAAPMASASDRSFAEAKVSSMQRESRSLAVADSAMVAGAGTAAARRIGARFFTLRDGEWTDARVDAPSASTIRRVRVKPYSDAYFALIRAIPDLGEPFALGDRVLVIGRAAAIELAADGSERLSDAQVAALSADW